MCSSTSCSLWYVLLSAGICCLSLQEQKSLQDLEKKIRKQLEKKLKLEAKEAAKQEAPVQQYVQWRQIKFS